MLHQDLIPGLPDDVARQCLLRVSYENLFLLKDVCTGWRQELFSPDFTHRRRVAGATQPLFAFAFIPLYDKDKDNSKKCIDMQFIALFNPFSGSWSRLPPIPFDNCGIYHHIVGVGDRIVTINLLVSANRNVIPCIYIYDLITQIWRCGTRCPFFHEGLLMACASDGARRVFLAGGMTPEGPVSSAMLYDVDEDKWERLPDMNIPRAGANGVYQNGEFYVTGGFNDDYEVIDPVHGPEERALGCAERLNVSTRDWNLELNFLPQPANIRTSCYPSPSLAADGKMYIFQDMKLIVKEGKNWRLVCELPSEVQPMCHMAWKGGFVLSEPWEAQQDRIFLVAIGADNKSIVWEEVKQPDEYEVELYIQTLCNLEL